MFGARLIVELDHELELVFNVFPAIRQFPARAIRFRKAGRDFYRSRTEQCGIDTVVYKRAPQRDLTACVAGRRSEGRKVAGQHCGCGNKGPHIGRVLTEGRALIPAEEKELVLDYRTAGRAAELIALQRTAFCCKIISRIK